MCRVGDSEHHQQFFKNGCAVIIAGFQWPVGIVLIHNSQMTHMQMRQHANEFAVFVSEDCVAVFQPDVFDEPCEGTQVEFPHLQHASGGGGNRTEAIAQFGFQFGELFQRIALRQSAINFDLLFLVRNIFVGNE